MSLTCIIPASALFDIIIVLLYSLKLALGCYTKPILLSKPKHCKFTEMPCLQEGYFSKKQKSL